MDKKYLEDYSLQETTENFDFESEWKKWLFFIDTQNLIFFPKLRRTFPKIFEKPTEKLKKEIKRLPKGWEKRPDFTREDMYGSRANGKTFNWILYQWYLIDLFNDIFSKNYITFCFIWTRVRLKECYEVFRTIILLAPLKFKQRLSRKRYQNERNLKNKININKVELTINYGKSTFRIINLIGKTDSVHQEDHSLVGWELGKYDVRFLMFEESYRMSDSMRAAAGVICRNQKVLFRINVLNNWSYRSTLIKDLDEQLPFDGYKMGKNLILSLKDYKNKKIMEKVQGFQYKEIKDQKRVIWKLNHIPLLRADLIKMEYIENLWFEATRDKLRKDTILWGKTGTLETGMFSLYMKKIIDIPFEQNIKDFRTNENWINSNFMVGIDLGYTFDKTVAVLVAISNDFKKIRILDTKIIKLKTTVLDIEKQMLSIVEFVKRKLKIYGWNFKNHWVSANSVHAVQLSIETKFQHIFGESLFYFYNFKRPLPLLERTNLLKQLISNSNFEIVDIQTNQNFKIELENLTYGNINIPWQTKRLGEDDIVEAFENAIFPMFNNIFSKAFSNVL